MPPRDPLPPGSLDKPLPCRQLDATGTFCPLPILLTAREIDKLEPGQCLEVLGDDVGILEDMPAWCRSTGHRLVAMEQVNETIRCLVKKKT